VIGRSYGALEGGGFVTQDATSRIATGQTGSRRTRQTTRRYMQCIRRNLDGVLLRGYYPGPGAAMTAPPRPFIGAQSVPPLIVERACDDPWSNEPNVNVDVKAKALHGRKRPGAALTTTPKCGNPPAASRVRYAGLSPALDASRLPSPNVGNRAIVALATKACKRGKVLIGGLGGGRRL
jgi:hypothetical protein